jgi:hypothetical protein
MHFSNSLEPAGLIQHFLHYPPENFVPVCTANGQPGFYMDFNLFTTAEPETVKRISSLPASNFLQRLFTWRTLFFGTTVSEYLPTVPDVDASTLLESMLTTWRRTSRLLIIKDVPEQSPLLPVAESAAATALLSACKNKGFTLIAGQALAYVTIDFQNEDEYLSRLSSGRRKNIRRKLRVRGDLHIDVIRTGSERLNDIAFLDELYALYLEVYGQSEIHFDKLTADFFAAVLQDKSLDGHLFLYFAKEKLIGFNLCFIHNGMLIDKYVGFRYPDARDYNLYFVSWMENLAFASSRRLSHYVAGWTDPEIKAYLGAKFTFTQHAVYVRNPLLRRVMGKFSRLFEHDKAWFEEMQR